MLNFMNPELNFHLCQFQFAFERLNINSTEKLNGVQHFPLSGFVD